MAQVCLFREVLDSMVKRSHRGDRSVFAALRRKGGGAFAWLAGCLLLLNLLAVAGPSAARGIGVTELPSGGIEICTPAGMMLLTADGEKLPVGGHADHGVLCQFCLPLMHGAAAVPATMALPLRMVLPQQVSAFAPPLAFVAQLFRALGQPRAPPAI